MSEWYMAMENENLRKKVTELKEEVTRLEKLLEKAQICKACGSSPGEYCKGKPGECKI